MLGVGAVPVRLTLAFELWILTLVGILLGLCAVGILTGTVSLPVLAAAALAYFAGSLIGAVIAGFMVTGARPLELLQVKE